MPKPGDYKDESSFMSDCISTVVGEGKTHDQAVGQCSGMWANKSIKKQAADDGGDDIEPEDDESEDDFMTRCTASGNDEDECSEIWDEYMEENGTVAKSSNSIVHKTHASETDGMDFVLSDATPDRFGDIIQAEGWDLNNFSKNPIALFNHNSDFPIGRWENLSVKGGELRGRLRMAPAGTSARIDEIRNLIDAGILKAVSVGFRPLEHRPLSKSAPGDLYVRSELVETSLVSVPANPNALAIAKGLRTSPETIALVFAKNGSRDGVVKKTGKQAEPVTMPVKRKTSMSPLAKRIETKVQKIAAMKEQLTQHLESLDDDKPSDEQTAITEQLSADIELHEKDFEALKRAETKLAVQAKQQIEEEVTNGSMQPMVIHNPRPFAVPAKKIQPIDYLWRSLTVAIKHHVEGRQRPILDIIKETYGEDEPTRAVVAGLVSKAAVVPATTTGSGWADTLVQTVIGEYIDRLTPYSVYPSLRARGGSFTFGRNGVITLPARSNTPTVAGAFVAQGAAIPVKKAAFSPVTLTPKKMGVITTMTREITEHSTPSIEAIIRNAILEDTGIAIDTILLDNIDKDTTRPEGFQHVGGAALTATAGGGIAALIGDIKAMLNDVITTSFGNLRSLVWIINPADVVAASLMQGATGSGDMPFRDELGRGTLAGFPVIQTTTGTNDTWYLVEAADFITATGDAPNFSVSDQAVLHEEDTTPLALASVATPNTVAAPMRSLWQTDTIAIRMIMDINWAFKRVNMVAWQTGLTWN